MKFNCEFCNDEVIQPNAWYKRSKTHTCSKECTAKLKHILTKTCICEICKIEFIVPLNHHKKKTCSKKCQQQYCRRRVSTCCKNCNKTFDVVKSRESTVNYCSYECARKYRTKETSVFKECCLCSKSFMRKKSTLKVQGKDIKNFFCSKTCKDKYLRGVNHPNYVEFKYRAKDKAKLIGWSLAVKERDHYTCQECNCADKNLLHAHHIKEYSKYKQFRFEIDNGITLCVFCHAKKHPEYSHLILNNSKLKAHEKET